MVKYRVDLYKGDKLVKSVSMSSIRKLTEKELKDSVKRIYRGVDFDRMEYKNVD